LISNLNKDFKMLTFDQNKNMAFYGGCLMVLGIINMLVIIKNGVFTRNELINLFEEKKSGK